MGHPLRAIFDVRRREAPLAALMFSYFFLVITSFWILKPLKKGLFVERYDAAGLEILGWHLRASQAELCAKLLNVAVAFAAMCAFVALSRRLRRHHLARVFTGFFLVCFAAFSFAVDRSSAGGVWAFYLLGDLFSTLMVASFFAFLADSVTAEQARRLYGVVGLGGVAGGAFGSLAVRAWISHLSISTWLWILFGVGACILCVASAAGRMVERRPPAVEESPAPAPGAANVGAALEGARLVAGSRYLLAIACMVGLYEVVSSLVDFQFTEVVAASLDGPAIGEHFSTVYSITNALALAVQLLATGFVMSRFGVTAALLVLPAALLGGATGFLAVPALATGSFLSVADNGLAYSINQSAREALYAATSVEEKYRAKAFIDMFVQRLAKAAGVLIGLALSAALSGVAGVQWLSVVVAALAVAWIAAARRAGRSFAKREASAPADVEAPLGARRAVPI